MRGVLSVTASDRPAEGQPDVSTENTEAPFDDVITLSTATGEDGTVTVTVVGEVDTFTAPVLRSSLDGQLEQSPKELVIDLSGVQFLGSAGLAVLVETQKAARSRDVGLRLIATTRAVTRPLEVTGLIDLFTIADSATSWTADDGPRPNGRGPSPSSGTGEHPADRLLQHPLLGPVVRCVLC